MPIYEYACDKCGHEFEAEQRITEDPLKSCPECRGRRVRRLISRTSFVLKGGGWYSDLYSSPGSRAASDAEGKSSDSDKGSETPGSKADAGKSDSTQSQKPSKAKKKDPKAAA